MSGLARGWCIGGGREGAGGREGDEEVRVASVWYRGNVASRLLARVNDWIILKDSLKCVTKWLERVSEVAEPNEDETKKIEVCSASTTRSDPDRLPIEPEDRPD